MLHDRFQVQCIHVAMLTLDELITIFPEVFQTGTPDH